MSKNLKNMDLNGIITPQTQLKMSGVIMGDNLEDTIKINSSRVDNNGEFLTLTKIVFNYIRFVNNTQLIGVTDKKQYLNIARELIRELNGIGLNVGDEWRDNNKLPYAKGNKKLPKSTVIINISPSSLCISKNNGLCDICGVCYALSSERRYINTLIYRLTQLIRFDELSVEEITSQLLKMRVFNTLRINESGDIFNMGDLYKLRDIAKILYDERGIISYVYTHRLDLDVKTVQTRYFKINRSGVDFIPSPEISSNHKTLYCDGECERCIYCKYELNIPITVLLHGDVDGEDLRDEETIKRDEIIKKISYDLKEYYGEDERDISEFIKTLLNIPFNPKNGEDIIGEICWSDYHYLLCEYCGECDGE